MDQTANINLQMLMRNMDMHMVTHNKEVSSSSSYEIPHTPHHQPTKNTEPGQKNFIFALLREGRPRESHGTLALAILAMQVWFVSLRRRHPSRGVVGQSRRYCRTPHVRRAFEQSSLESKSASATLFGSRASLGFAESKERA
jgi:hypothetical protein